MKKILLVFLMIALSLSVLAQESNCGDGIDNDGDGFIDCFDSNCANNVVCKDFYVGRDKLCQVPPSGVAKFEMKLGAKSPDRTTWTSGTMVVGDLDNDGIPEVVTLHQDNKKLYILDGRDLTIKYPLGGNITGVAEYFDHTIGNIKRDNCGDIFIAEKEGGTFYISSYDCKGVLQWRVPIYGQPITMGLADFDEDGKVELYYRNEILDAETGLRLVKGSGTWTTIDAGPVAVDILADAECTNCAGLELVLGGRIYAVNLGARTLDAGTLSLTKSIPAGANYYPKLTSFGWVSSLTSVADYNQDGSLDVLMSGATGSTGGATSVFFWDVKNAAYKVYQPPNNWQHGTGRLNIADIDGDGKSNTTFVSGNRLYALKEDFTPLWPAISININEGTSGYTSTTVFDFNNDNAVEIVYRDEAYLYIINGKTGSVFTQATCRSRTANDYPVVADVDGDGSTEICVICATNDTDNINDISRAPYGQVRTYKSNLAAWVPARKVWNQHGYFNVNVNDDLTIPRIQQKHHLIFSSGSCTTGPNRALNTFLNQSPFLDTKGCPTYASPDVTYDASSVKITPPTCPDQAFKVSLNIKNIGDLGLSGILPITFYQGNPTQAGAVKLNTVNINLTKFNVNDVVSLTDMTVQGTGSNFTLFVVLNDNGSTVPTPIKLPNSTFTECNYTNNIVSAGVSPTPFTIQTALISNDIKCGSNAVPSNGAAEVYRLVGATKETVGYTFYWFNSATVGDTSQAVFKGPVRTGLAAGTYSIIAYHKGAKCSSTSAQVVVGQQTRTLTAVITENSPYTSCKHPDGKLTVAINGGDPFGNYTYEWFEGNVFGTSPILSKSHVITNVSNVTYSVLVTEKATGCQILASAKVTDNTVKPVVTATVTEANCNPSNSGSATAKVGGATNGYDFYWYNGSSVKPASDFSGSTYSNITVGDYTVVATSKSTGCSSEPLVVTVVSKQIVPVTATVTSHQTSCTAPSGAASALVSGSVVGYTFKWFKGNNTLPANLIGSSPTIAGLAAGVYTVEATNTSNGCIDTEIITINDSYFNPVVTAATTITNTNCTGITPNGLITINIDGVAPAAGQFTVEWFEGNGTTTTLGTTVGSVTGVSNITAQGLSAGTYTVRVTDIVTPSNGCSTTTTFTITNTLAVVTIDNLDIVLVHQSNCSPVNGSATVNEITVNGTGAGNTTGYTFKWLQSNGTTIIPGSGNTATIAVPLAAGSYFVQATNATTNCKSPITAFTINDTHVNPVVTAATTINNTNCTGATPNGSITINIGGVAPVVGQFNIEWFEGNGTTTTLGTTVGSVIGVSNITAQGLSAGTYTVRVTDLVTPNTGCSTTSTFTITNTPAVITIDNADIALVHQSNCSPVNGSATVNEITVNGIGAGNTTGYTFIWLQSNGTTVIPGSGSAATIAVSLASGNYFVQTTNTATNCKSANTPFTINDTHVNPVVTAASTVNNTNCTGATPNGSITINIGGVAPAAGQFTVEWFEGNGTTTTLGTTVGSVAGASNQTAQALSAGTYTVRVTDLVTPNTGCSTTATFTITNTPTVVTIDNADIALGHQSNCSPANGSATVNEITVNGTGAGNTTGYTFTWLQSNGTTIIPSSGNAATIAVPLAAGNYFVQATNTATNCKSANTPFTINDTHVNPAVAAATTINNTNCAGSTPTGSITINIGGVAPAAGQFNVEWFEGNGTIITLGTTVGSVTGVSNITAQALSAGTYTVRVTDLITTNTGCSTTSTFTITDTPAAITVESADISLAHQTNCSPANGSATVNEITVNGIGAGNTTGYTFIWLQSNGATVIPGSGSAATIAVPLAAGNYFVQATNTTTNCKSANTPFTINDTHVNPAVTAASTVNNTNCTGATPNGSITINIGGVAPAAGQFTVEWFEGNGTTTPLGTTVGSVTGVSNITAQGLSAGTYTVRVTDLVTPNTGCSTTTTFTITNTPAVVTIDNLDIVLVHQSNCSPVNGSATVNEVTVNGAGLGNTTGYTFTWLQSNGTTVIPGSGNAATIAVPLAAGSYFVQATNATTNCKSANTPFTINDTHVNPVVTAATTINNTNCTGATPNGSITINIGGVAPVAGQFNIEWFEGNGTTTTLGTTVGSVTGVSNITAQGLSAGTYTVRVTDLVTPNTGCLTTSTFTITNTPAVVTVESADISLAHQTNCSPANGSATVNEITVNGIGAGNTTGYTFIWFQSNGTTVIPGSGSAATIAVPLASGNYFVQTTNTATNCKSANTPFTINDTHVNPVVTAASTVNNTNCTGATPNGSITINIGGVAPVAGEFNIEWFEGNGTTTTLGTTVGSVTGVSNITAQGLSAGTYTVRVTDLVTPNNGCSTTTTFTITNTLAVVTIDNVDITLGHQSNCSPVNGSATVNEITVNGTGLGNTTGYTFTWLQSNGTTIIAGSGNAATIAVPLAAGSYFVQATNATTNCKSPITSFIINDTHVNPVVALLAAVDNTHCTGVAPNGSITIQINGGASVADFTIEWFEGNGTSTPLGTTVGITGGLNNEMALEIVGGTYTVRVTDNVTPNSGCSFTASFTITDNLSYPAPSGTPLANTACDPTKSNGSILADVGGTTVGYTFHIFRGQNTLLLNEVTSGPATAANLEAGIYTVQAITDATGCSATTEVSVINNIVLPTIDMTASTMVNSCSTPDGSASVTAVSIGVLADYTFSWYIGNGLKAVADYTGTTASGLLSGNYTVAGKNNVLGCDVQAPVTVTVANAPNTIITISELLGERIVPAICNDAQGQLGVQASSPANTLGFAFSWFQGDKNVGMTPEGSGQNFPLNSNRISNAASLEPIGSGLHTVIALDNNTGCRDSLTINLPYSDEAALLSILTSPQTDCIVLDGSFDAEITPSAGTLLAHPTIDQTWYRIDVFQNGLPVKSVPGTNPSTIVTGLAAGNYTVLAVETNPALSGCTSAPNDINIADNKVYPTIAGNVLIDNKNCIGAPGTGSISLSVDGVPTPAAGYTYDWYDGKLITDPVLPVANVLAPGHTAMNIDEGFYTVEVTSAVNNCTAKETLHINADPFVISIPSASLDITDQTECSPDNGSAEVLDVFVDGISSGGVVGYTFQWFLNDGTSTIPLSSTNANVGTPIGANNYFVKATNTTSNCASPLVQFTVDDVSVTPVITQNTITNNTNCSGAASNGSITIDVDGVVPAVTDYTIQWYSGIGTSSPIVGATTETLSNLLAGDYTVEVTDILSPGNTCSSTAIFTIVDDLPVFTINNASITVGNQTDCLANGSATVTDILIDGVSNGGTTGFTFEWFDDAGVSIDGPGATDVVGVSLAAGTYRVVATNTTSLCSSSVTLFTVNDVSVTPVITQNTITNNTNCSGAASNGSITIDVDGVVPAVTDFTIQWYSGIGTSSPIVGATTETLSNLSAGDYTVEVTDILSPGNTCSSTAIFTIVDDLPVFTINNASITVGNQTDCLANGSATVTDILIDGVSNGGTTGFTFEWFDDAGVSIDGPGATDVVGVSLAAGTYRVVATNTTSLCSSSVTLFTVNDVSVTPVITQNTITNNTNCSGAASNGSITIDVDGVVPAVTDFTIQWYSGIGTSSSIVGATTETLSNLSAGDYTVEVTDILSPGNTCSSTAIFTIVDDLPVFTINNASITVGNQTDCLANGSATVTDILIDGVSNGGTTGFTFEWFDDAGVSIDGPGATDVVGVSLAAGTYRVVATNTTSLCSSSVTLFTVNDVSVTPVITQNTITNNTNCSGAASNGSITIDVDGVVPAVTDFTIQWYSGIGTSSPIVGATTETLSNLSAGDYTVEVTDILSPGNTCSSTAIFTIVDDLPVFTINNASITVGNQTDCLANGSATVTDILIDGVSNGGTTGFTFEWFDDAGVSIDGPGATDVVGVSLAAGTYRVVATNTTSLCSSSVTLFTVNDVSVTPVITQNTITNNTNCSGAASNGSITIDVDGVVPAVTDFTIQWYSGIGTSSSIVGATTETLSNLSAGDYTVEVTDILSPGNTCSSTAIFTIVDDLPVFTITNASITVGNQTDCLANGSATVTDILIDGVSNGGTTGFTFEWFDDAGVSIDGPGATDVVGVSLAAGTYRVVATNTTSLCSSSVTLFTVNDVSVTPVITQNTITNNTNCSGAASNGSITIDVDGVVPAVTDFTIQWYSGIGTSSSIVGATTETLSNLSAGDYTVEVTDILSPGNTCSSTAIFTIVDDLPVFTINNASITVGNQTDCLANGSATVTDILIDGVSNGGTTGFTFEWFDDAGVSIDGPGATDVVGVSLAAGTYRVVATNTTSLCSSSVTLFTVNDVSVTPVITQNTITNNTNCSGAASNGSITIDVDGVVPAVTDFTIQWYSGIGTSSPIVGATTETLSNQSAGDYTVEVTDILSPGNTCSSTAIFTIIETQNIVGINNNDIAIIDNSDCQPVIGSASVTDVIFNGLPVGNTTGYVFEWLQSDFTPVDPGNGPTVGVNLIANDYYVRATHVASNCISPLTPFSIKDVTVIPVVVAIKDFDNIACNTNYTGQLSATVSEGSTTGVTAGYTFEWFSGINNTNAADFISSGPVLSGMQEGDYTVLVTDTSTPSGNCTNTATLTIDRKIPVFNGTLTANAQTMCIPVQDGSMTVNSIQQFLGGATTFFDMSNVIDLNKFSFQWFDESLVSIAPVSNGNNISPNLEEGTFYVQISDALGCTSDYITGVIDDETAKPQIALDEFKNPAVCILPEVQGSLFVSADNNSNFADYTFEWFEGNNTTGTLVEPNSPFLGNIDYTGILEYTARVTNNATQCFTLETYKFKTDTVAIQVVASAVPLTSCVTDNGSLFAATRTGSGQLYTIEWHNGSVIDATPDFTSNEVLIAPIGTYTAVAKHPTLNFCTSIPDTVSVTDGRVYPQVTAMQKAPLTYCDPNNPNGVAVATVNGSVIGYTFDWYEGSATISTYTGSEAGILGASTYVVKATDVISGCAGTTSITIENDPLAVPVPQITLLSDRTDCEILDGSLSADVNGVTKDHVFNWYNGPAVKNQVDASGELYEALDAGVYTVTATDRVSGCTSIPVQREIISAMQYPDFDIITVNTICNENIGSVSIKVSGDVEVKEIQWDIQGAIEVGPQASGLPSGVFTVTAISFKNCKTPKTFEIKTDLSIYNGVSRNSDGLNDIFEVGCISEYPNNSVRIFNRAGTLVFEASGYNNEDIYFDGISNRGVNILGNDLPDGTYFYIINKGDGSEPKTGYLELLH